jgi:hypothetical protein
MSLLLIPKLYHLYLVLRLFGYNMGIHLIEGEPVQRKSEIDPMDEHMSFQVQPETRLSSTFR